MKDDFIKIGPLVVLTEKIMPMCYPTKIVRSSYRDGWSVNFIAGHLFWRFYLVQSTHNIGSCIKGGKA